MEIKPVFLLFIIVLAILLLLNFGSCDGKIDVPIQIQPSFARELDIPADVPADFPADFSADLSPDVSAGSLSPISRGAADTGARITALAVSRLGDTCFQQQAKPGEYMDCSALVQWCYEQIGVSLPRTAAGQAEFCQEHLLTVPRSQLQYGDLIFWSFEKNGRFKNISHTGIYAGNGKIIDASYSRGQVVYRDLYSPAQIVMCGRVSGR